jgi:hypothetical protein
MNKNFTNLLVIDGGAVKTEAEGIVEGMGIVFGDENEPDQSKQRDFFTKDSFVRRKESFTVPLYYEHGFGLINTEIGEAVLTKEEAGWKAVAEIDVSDELGKKVYEAVKTRPHGFSTGALQHLVRREAKSNNTHFLKSWVVGELSLTERPAEPKAIVEAVKSIDGSVAYVDAFSEEPLKEADQKNDDDKLVAVFNENGEKLWDIDEEAFAKIKDIIKDSAKCGDYSYVSASSESTSITLSPETDVADLIANLERALEMLRSFSAKNLSQGFENRLVSKVEEIVKGSSKDVSELQEQLKGKEEELADLRTKVSDGEDALTQANEKIAQLEILAAAKETINKHKGI